MKPKILNKLEDNFCFSELQFLPLPSLYKFWNSKKVTKIYEKSSTSESGISTEEVLYKSVQNFYIHIIFLKDDSWSMTIYYKIEQESELKLFTKNLIKQIKDATNSNK